MTALIFGAAGQDGHYLGRMLEEKGVEVVRVSRTSPWIQGDVADYAFVEEVIRTHRPDYIFHLAANSTAAHEAWMDHHQAISGGTLYILETVHRHLRSARVFLSGSGLQFLNDGSPISETAPFAATSPYAVARIQSVYAARYYKSLGVQAYVGYFFNHDSPLRSERHMSMKIAAFAKRVAEGSEEILTIGDASVEKEWGFAGDVVEAIWTLVSQDQAQEAVIGTGQGFTIRHWLDACFGVVGLSPEKHVAFSNDFVPQYQRLVSDPRTIKSLGWQPRTSFTDLARMMVNH